MQQSRILVIEDDPLARRAYERVLAKEHAVVAVGSGSEALEVLGEQRFAAILSDIDVPGVSGIELLKAVRRMDAELPVVLVTGFPSFESAQDAVNYGAYRYLTKPVDAAALREAVGLAAQLGAGRPTAANEAPNDELERFENALNTLWMAFQPIVSWRQRRVVGYEALMRTEEKSLARPPDLLALAEKLRRLDELGRIARRRIADAIPHAPPDALVFVNLHARDLEQPELHDGSSPLAPHAERIVLEITERASVEGVQNLARHVGSLRNAGYRLAIDDLGAGYAGLTSVTQLEPEVVKLDMSLVRGIDASTTKQHLVHSISRVCRDLGMTVVVEGVETSRERDTLIELGCDVLQGYFFGRPVREFAQPAFVD